MGLGLTGTVADRLECCRGLRDGRFGSHDAVGVGEAHHLGTEARRPRRQAIVSGGQLCELVDHRPRRRHIAGRQQRLAAHQQQLRSLVVLIHVEAGEGTLGEGARRGQVVALEGALGGDREQPRRPAAQ